MRLLTASLVLAAVATGMARSASGPSLPDPRSPIPDPRSLGFPQEDADRLQEKLEAIVRFGAIPRLETQSTAIEEREVNAYLEHYLGGEIPPGISAVALKIHGDTRISGSATLDLDALKADRASSEGFDPLSLLSGKLPARVSGRLLTTNGTGRFELESAELSGVPLPRFLVQQLVTYYSRSSDQPEGISLDDPFDLPSSIREIRIEPGQAVVVQ